MNFLLNKIKIKKTYCFIIIAVIIMLLSLTVYAEGEIFSEKFKRNNLGV